MSVTRQTLILLTAAAVSLSSYAQVPPTGSDVLLAKAHAKGGVRVIAHLRSQRPAGARNIASAAERQAIAADVVRVQQRVLGRLAIPNPATTKRFKYVPSIALEADEQTLRALLADPEVVRVVEDASGTAQLKFSVPLVGGPAAFARGQTGAGQTIVILDTGIESAHQFLMGKVLAEICFSSSGTNLVPLCPQGTMSGQGFPAGEPCTVAADCSHGTWVAGVAAGKLTVPSDVLPSSGVAMDATLISIQIYTEETDTSGCFPKVAPCVKFFFSDVALALEWVLDNRSGYSIAAVNLSGDDSSTLFTTTCDSDPQMADLKTHIDDLRSVGIPTVVSSGNNGSPNSVARPACISSAVSVGATTKVSPPVVTSYSNGAAFLTILAPGGATGLIPGVGSAAILSSMLGNSFGTDFGTSAAAPHVAGAFAILKAAAPTATLDQIQGALIQGSSVDQVVDTRSNATAGAKPFLRIDRALDALPLNIPALIGIINSLLLDE